MEVDSQVSQLEQALLQQAFGNPDTQAEMGSLFDGTAGIRGEIGGDDDSLRFGHGSLQSGLVLFRLLYGWNFGLTCPDQAGPRCGIPARCPACPARRKWSGAGRGSRCYARQRPLSTASGIRGAHSTVPA